MGKVAEIKTKQNMASVSEFIEKLTDDQQRKDSQVIIELMQKASGEEPKMWGASMIGFGIKRYKSPKTGREVDWFQIGFSPRKANLSLYLMINHKENEESIKNLGKHKTSGGCIYIKKLIDIDINVLKSMIDASLHPDKINFF